MAKIVYMSFSGNTKKFVEKLGDEFSSYEIDPANPMIENGEKYILIVPSYEDVCMYEHVLDFLETGDNVENCQGIFSAGNMTFQAFGLYGVTAKKINEEFGIEILRFFELRGGKRDVESLREELNKID